MKFNSTFVVSFIKNDDDYYHYYYRMRGGYFILFCFILFFIWERGEMTRSTCLEDGDSSPKQSVEVFPVADATGIAVENLRARARSGAVLSHAKFTAKQIHA